MLDKSYRLKIDVAEIANFAKTPEHFAEVGLAIARKAREDAGQSDVFYSIRLIASVERLY
jgi:hypothetical protein